MALVLLVGSPQFHVRPLVLTIGLLAVTFAWLVDVEAGRKRLGQLWWLVPLFVLWTNLHGGVLGGMGTVGLCAAGWCVLAWSAWQQLPRRAGVGCGDVRASSEYCSRCWPSWSLPTLVNPYGLDLPREWLETLAMPLPSLIEEHAPLTWPSRPAGRPCCWPLVYLAVLVGASGRAGRGSPGCCRWSGSCWRCQRVRNAPLFGVTAAIAAGRHAAVTRAGPMVASAGMLGPPRPPSGWRAAVLPLLRGGRGGRFKSAGVSLPVVGRGWARFDPDRWPVELLPQLDEINRSSRGRHAHLQRSELWRFLDLLTPPRLRVFIDDRCALYGGDFLAGLRPCPARGSRPTRPVAAAIWIQLCVGGDRRHVRPLFGRLSPWTPWPDTPAATLYQRRMGVSPPMTVEIRFDNIRTREIPE